MSEIAHGDRIGKFGQVAQDAVHNGANVGMVPFAISPQKGTRVDEAQSSKPIEEEPLGDAGQSAFAFAGEALEVFDQLIELKEKGTRIGVIKQDEVINRGNIRQQVIAASIR